MEANLNVTGGETDVTLCLRLR